MSDIIPIINCNLQWRQRQAIYAKQGEYGARKVKIFLYNGSNSYEVPDSGISAVFAYKRPDGFSDSYDTIDGVDAIALSPSDNSATVTLAQNVLAVPGTVECELQLLTSGTMIATFTFYIIVEASVAPGTEPSEHTTNPFVRSPADIGSGYAICSTAAATTAKTAQIDGYKLTIGGRVSIRFDNAVPANATLNISNTGAKDIDYHGSIVTGSLISAGDLVTFVYNGVRYCVTAIDASQSGGGGTVTPAAVVAATGDMTVQQAANTRENIGAGTYSKPADGISIYDLKSDVQQSISRADNAVLVKQQSLTEMQKLQALVNLGVDTAVLYSNQTLNELQKNVARTNIGAGTYSKPSGGIPLTDLAQAVQNLLAAAGTALQPPTVQTVTGNTPTIAAAADNTVYNCIGSAITAVEVTSYSYGTAFSLIFDAQVGTAPTLTLDGRITMPDDFSVEANRHYEINVDFKGYATVQSWTLVD